MGALVAWLIVVAATSRTMRKHAIGRRVTAVLSLVSLSMLTLSILWGVLGNTQHGLPPTQASVFLSAGLVEDAS